MKKEMTHNFTVKELNHTSYRAFINRRHCLRVCVSVFARVLFRFNNFQHFTQTSGQH